MGWELLGVGLGVAPQSGFGFPALFMSAQRTSAFLGVSGIGPRYPVPATGTVWAVGEEVSVSFPLVPILPAHPPAGRASTGRGGRENGAIQRAFLMRNPCIPEHVVGAVILNSSRKPPTSPAARAGPCRSKARPEGLLPRGQAGC